MIIKLIHNKLPKIGTSHQFSKFIILTYPRTGSNFLIFKLQFSNKIICYNELFYSKSKLVSSYEDLIFQPWTAIYRNLLTKNFLNEIFLSYQDYIKAVGFKLTYAQDEMFGNKNLIDILANKYQVKFIHLKRKNLLKSYISKKLLEKTNIVYAVNDSYINYFNKHTKRTITSSKLNEYIPQIIIDTEDYIKYIDITNDFQLNYNKKIKDYPYIDVFYEDLINQTELTIKNIGNLLNISNLSSENNKKEFPISKLNNRTLKKIIVNYSEVENYLLKKGFAHYLE